MIENKDTLINIRTKILGVLIRDARLAARRSTKECARAIGISFRRYRSFEYGQQAPSLPELETLAYYLDVPMKHFWSDRVISGEEDSNNDFIDNNFISERDQSIGKYLRDKRNKMGLTLKQVAADTDLSEKTLRKYELGKSMIPVPELEILLQRLNIQLEEVFDENNDIGTWRIAKDNVDNFLELPVDVQTFVTNDSNLPFLELAQRLRDLPADKLRDIAEGLLEITL